MYCGGGAAGRVIAGRDAVAAGAALWIAEDALTWTLGSYTKPRARRFAIDVMTSSPLLIPA